jgi:mannose-6-phosphate isomerase-like protein (cupin superfamily)
MTDWTRRNFEDIEDRSPAGVSIRWLFSRDQVGSQQVGVSRFSYPPGERMPFGHKHTVQEEVYVIVSGSGRAKLGDEIVDLDLWDVLRVEPQVVRSFEAGPEGMEVICVGGQRPEGGDGEPVEGFWVD